MAEANNKVKRFQRSDLALFLPTQRLIKEFDALSAAVVDEIPGSLDELTVLIEVAQLGADTAQALAQSAGALAQVALNLARGLDEGPPAAPQIPSDTDDQVPSSLLLSLHAQLATLTRRVSDLEERPTP